MRNVHSVRQRVKTLLSAALITVSGAPLVVTAQTANESAIEEIVVTAQYREQSVQDVPIAISAFSGEQLANAGVTDLQDLSRLAPDFTAINDLGFVRLSVRGVQSNSNDESGDQALVFNIDGDYINRGNFINSAMFDLERVEILRGPQGTLYGRNATGGAVNAIARKPSLDGVEGNVSADFGDYSWQVFNGAINVPLGSMMAVRVAAMSAEHDGYTTHPNFTEATNDQDTQAGRIGFLVEPNEAFSIYLAAEHAKDYFVPQYAAVSANTTPYQADGPPPGTGTCSAPGWSTAATFVNGFGCAPYTTDYLSGIDRSDFVSVSPWLGDRDQKTTAYRAHVNYDTDNIALTYRFAYRDSEWGGANPLPGLMFYREEEIDTTTHEFRISNGNDDGLFWQAGLFYLKENLDGFGGLHLPFGGQADPMGVGLWLNTFYRLGFQSESKAAFGQIEVPFADTFTAVIGARYTEDDKKGTFYNFAGPPAVGPGGIENLRPVEDANVVFPATYDNGETTWSVGLNYEPTESALHFVKISKGYKAGGFDAVGNYDPETNIAYEIGSKNQFERSLFNIDAFYYDYTDLQASVLLDTTVGGQIFNAGEADIWGIEADYEISLTDNDRLTFTANYLSAEFTRFSPLEEPIQCVGGCDANTIPSDASGNTLPNSPEWILTVGYEHTWDLSAGAVTASIFSRYKSDYFNTVFNYRDGNQEAYTQTDVGLEWVSTNGEWSVLAYGRNLEDERPLNFYQFISAGPNDDFNWGFGPPRTYGLMLSYNYQ